MSNCNEKNKIKNSISLEKNIKRIGKVVQNDTIGSYLLYSLLLHCQNIHILYHFLKVCFIFFFSQEIKERLKIEFICFGLSFFVFHRDRSVSLLMISSNHWWLIIKIEWGQIKNEQIRTLSIPHIFNYWMEKR